MHHHPDQHAGYCDICGDPLAPGDYNVCKRCNEPKPDGYTIGCRVSGGITGTRKGTLKDGKGNAQYFDSYEAAVAETVRLNKEMNGPNASARFHYWVHGDEDGN